MGALRLPLAPPRCWWCTNVGEGGRGQAAGAGAGDGGCAPRGAEGVDAEAAEVEAENRGARARGAAGVPGIESGLREPGGASGSSGRRTHLLDLISFFTVGRGRSARPGPSTAEDKAPRAAGKIHSDLERSFIRGRGDPL